MATGDMKNNLKQLQTELRAVKYSKDLDVEGMVSGSPAVYLSIYHYLFTTYSTKLNKDISDSNNELYSKSDKRFMEAVYKILRDLFQYKPQITREQFFSTSFAEHKAIMAKDIVRLVHSRYEQTKSSAAFKIGPSKEERLSSKKEKVQVEPVEKPRKVASKSSRNVAGAIVLPSHVTSSASAFRIPKPVISGPFPHQYEPPSAGAAEAQYRERGRHRWGTGTLSDGIQEDSSPESPHTPQSMASQLINVEGEVRKQVTEMLSPALVAVKERLGNMEHAIKKIAERDTTAKVPTEQPSSAAITTELSRQMNDVLFRLDTLSSRIVLVENRLMMVEARLEDEANYRKILAQSRSFTQSNTNQAKTIPQDIWAEKMPKPSCQQRGATQESLVQRNSPRNQTDDAGGDGNIVVAASGGDEDDDVEVVEVRANQDSAKANMDFMKALVGNEDSASLTADTTGLLEMTGEGFEPEPQPSSQPKVQSAQNQKPPKAVKPNILGEAFDDLVSPIRNTSGKRTDQVYQDESAFSIPCGDFNEAEDSDRRSSTPTHLNLDMSTLDRVNRIHQMMAETQQLFH